MKVRFVKGHIPLIKGKTYEEFYGKERAKEIKNKRSEWYKNPENMKKHGETHGDKTRKRMSKTRKRLLREGKVELPKWTVEQEEKIRRDMSKNNPMFKEETKRKRSKTMTGRHYPKMSKAKKGKKHSSEARSNMRRSRLEFLKKHPEMHPNRILAKNRKKLTSLEKRMLTILEQNFTFEKDFYHNKLVKVENNNYYPDFLFPESKLIIEVDGSWWHQDEQKDQLRQSNLESIGYRVIRFRDDELNDEKHVLEQLGITIT